MCQAPLGSILTFRVGVVFCSFRRVAVVVVAAVGVVVVAVGVFAVAAVGVVVRGAVVVLFV